MPPVRRKSPRGIKGGRAVSNVGSSSPQDASMSTNSDGAHHERSDELFREWSRLKQEASGALDRVQRLLANPSGSAAAAVAASNNRTATAASTTPPTTTTTTRTGNTTTNDHITMVSYADSTTANDSCGSANATTTITADCSVATTTAAAAAAAAETPTVVTTMTPSKCATAACAVSSSDQMTDDQKTSVVQHQAAHDGGGDGCSPDRDDITIFTRGQRSTNLSVVFSEACVVAADSSGGSTAETENDPRSEAMVPTNKDDVGNDDNDDDDDDDVDDDVLGGHRSDHANDRIQDRPPTATASGATTAGSVAEDVSAAATTAPGVTFARYNMGSQRQRAYTDSNASLRRHRFRTRVARLPCVRVLPTIEAVDHAEDHDQSADGEQTYSKAPQAGDTSAMTTDSEVFAEAEDDDALSESAAAAAAASVSLRGRRRTVPEIILFPPDSVTSAFRRKSTGDVKSISRYVMATPNRCFEPFPSRSGNYTMTIPLSCVNSQQENSASTLRLTRSPETPVTPVRRRSDQLNRTALSSSGAAAAAANTATTTASAGVAPATPDCRTPISIASCLRHHTPCSKPGHPNACRKREVANFDTNADPSKAPLVGTPVATGADLKSIFRTMDVYIPTVLLRGAEHGSSQNSAGRGTAAFEVESQLGKAFLESYKLIAKGIDHTKNLYRIKDTMGYGSGSGTPAAGNCERGRRRSDSTNQDEANVNVGDSQSTTMLDQILEGVVAPLKALADDPDAEEALNKLEAIEALLYASTREMPLDTCGKNDTNLFHRRVTPGVYEFGRRLRNVNEMVSEDLVKATFLGRDHDVRGLLRNLHGLLRAYQRGAVNLGKVSRQLTPELVCSSPSRP